MLLFLILGANTMIAQSVKNVKIATKGVVVDKENGEGIPFASIRFCNPKDSSLIKGVAAESDGTFYLADLSKREYLVVVSSIGYNNYYRTVNLRSVKRLFDAGRIELAFDVVQLKEAVVTANVPKVEASGDSLVYSTKAYKVPEGSMLEDLIKKFPGAKVDENGNLTLNGKTVTKILIGGKEFFVSDMSVAMKNIPADMVDNIKFYDKKSDLARVTGIDDGNEEPVLDLSVKKDMTRGVFSNIDIAGGTRERYNVKLNVNRFKPDENYTLIGDLRNVEGKWSWDNGTTKRNSLRSNFFKKTEKLEIGGDVNYSYAGGDASTTSSSETFLDEKNSSFSNNVSRNIYGNYNFDANLRIEWKPDTLTNIIFRPRFSFSDNSSWNDGLSATFNQDPYMFTKSPLEDIMNETLFVDGSRINRTVNNSYTNAFYRNAGMELQFFRRLNSKGRSITLRSEGSYSDNDSRQFNRSDVNYFLFKSVTGGDSVYYRNQFYKTPADNRDISAHVMYTEPIANKVYLKFGYKFTYRFNNNNRSTYDLTPYIDFSDVVKLGFLPDYYGEPLKDLSKFAEYDNAINSGDIALQIDREKMNLNVGLRLENVNTTMDCDQVGLDTVVSRNITNISPNLFFRYRFDKHTQLRINYHSYTSQPDMISMLPIRDETNPMWITEGNPNLKSSFTNRVNVSFHTYNPEKQRGIYCHTYFTNTFNNISSKITYDNQTGGVVSRSENVNGNWSSGMFFGFNTPFKNERFSVDSHSGISLNNNVGYARMSSTEDSRKNRTFTGNLHEWLRLNFRNDVWELSMTGNIEYERADNKLLSSGDLELFRYGYGFEGLVNLPYNIKLSTDINHSVRTGYADDAFNTDELVWNAQLSYSFLKEKKATFSLELYDILQERSIITRSMSATSRSDSRLDDVLFSYWMVHFIYKFNIFGI